MTFGGIFSLICVIVVGSIAIGGLISLLIDFAKYLWEM